MSRESDPPSWWQTVPGMLTATAAVLTALTGLIVAVDGARWLEGPRATPPEPPQVQAAEPARSSAAGPAAPEGPPTLDPALREVGLGEATYTVLDIVTEPRSLEAYTLRIHLRVLTTGPYGVNFWDRTFRLLVDGVPRAPVGGLNEVVEGHSAKEGEVVFHVPAPATSLVLQLRFNEEVAEIPLRRTSP